MPASKYIVKKGKNAGKTKWRSLFYYTDWQGVRRKVWKEGFASRKDALNFEADFLNRIAGDASVTYDNLCKLYLEDCKARLRITTYQQKEYMFVDKITPAFGKMPINEIKPSHIRYWQNKMMSHTPKFTQTYLRTINNQMSALFNYAVKYYGLKENPVRIAGTIGKKHSDRIDFWTLDDYHKAMEYVPNESLRLAYELLYFTGMRKGELLALTQADVDFTKETISINKTFTRLNKQDIITEPKTPKGKRTVSVPSSVMEHLKAYISKIDASYSEERIFFSVSKYELARKLNYIAAEAGVKKIRVHDFRHSHASLLIELGYSPLLISQRLGHENIETTLQIYAHLYPNKEEELVSRLDSMVSKAEENKSTK